MTDIKLHDLTATEMITDLAEQLKDMHPELTKAKAKKVIINTLSYMCVQEEILGQADFILKELDEAEDAGTEEFVIGETPLKLKF